jgi:hypothetical protein
VQDPAELAGLIVTDVATMAPFAGVPVAVTQSPTATAEAGTVTIWLNRVVGVQFTVTWPACWFCTSIDCPVMAATEPEAPGNDPPPPGVAPELLPELPEEPELPDEPVLAPGAVPLLLLMLVLA